MKHNTQPTATLLSFSSLSQTIGSLPLPKEPGDIHLGNFLQWKLLSYGKPNWPHPVPLWRSDGQCRLNKLHCWHPPSTQISRALTTRTVTKVTGRSKILNLWNWWRILIFENRSGFIPMQLSNQSNSCMLSNASFTKNNKRTAIRLPSSSRRGRVTALKWATLARAITKKDIQILFLEQGTQVLRYTKAQYALCDASKTYKWNKIALSPWKPCAGPMNLPISKASQVFISNCEHITNSIQGHFILLEIKRNKMVWQIRNT